MDISRLKNGIGIAVLVLLAAALIFAVVFTAVQSNKTSDETEIFIDKASIDYSSESEAVYAVAFQRKLSSIFNTLAANTGAGSVDANPIVLRIMSACSKARIPAVKLQGAAYVIENLKVDFDGTKIDINSSAEEIANAIYKESVKSFASIVNQFFSNSSVTEEEFARFLYYFLSDEKISPADYRSYIEDFGMDNFVNFAGSTLYIIKTVSDEEGQQVFLDSSILNAVLYQYGTILLNATVNAEAFEGVLKLDFSFTDDDGVREEELNALAAKTKEFHALLARAAGYIFRNSKEGITPESVRNGIIDAGYEVEEFFETFTEFFENMTVLHEKLYKLEHSQTTIEVDMQNLCHTVLTGNNPENLNLVAELLSDYLYCVMQIWFY